MRERAGDLDRVCRQVGGRGGLARPVDQPLAVKEAERQLLVVSRRAHRHRHRLAGGADLQRLLDRDLVSDSVVLDPRQHPHVCGVIHRGRS